MESIYFLLVAILGFIFGCWLYHTQDNAKVSSADMRVENMAKKIGELQSQLGAALESADRVTKELISTQDKFDKLQHQKISADVKLGQKAEVLLPFLDSFPYKDDYIVGTYNPIDLIVFREDEVVFVEVKSGQSQLSKSQKQIRDNVKAGRVRFEVHRMNEKGVTVK